MISDWLERVGSSVPRGFSRFFILEALKDKPHTGKELIDLAEEKSEGKWKPSPGLIYPLLGRLLDEELIEEKNGKYHITEKGESVAGDIDTIQEIVKNQLDVLLKLGSVGSFVAKDMIERVTTIGKSLSSNVTNMTNTEKERYRKFLESELKKISGNGGANSDSSSSQKKTKRGKKVKVE